jgi:hypothetical protein
LRDMRGGRASSDPTRMSGNACERCVRTARFVVRLFAFEREASGYGIALTPERRDIAHGPEIVSP